VYFEFFLYWISAGGLGIQTVFQESFRINRILGWTVSEGLLFLRTGRTCQLPDPENCPMEELRIAIDCCWTAAKLYGRLRENRKLDLSYPTPVRYLRQQDYARRIRRLVPEQPDRELWIAQREDFASGLLELLAGPCIKTFFG
jgi:hypothetical protein